LRELAQFCPSTALALSMHQHLLAAAVWRHLHGQPAEALLRKIAEAELVLVSTGAGDWLESNGKAERIDGGYRRPREHGALAGLSHAGAVSLPPNPDARRPSPGPAARRR
jgi:hypothetical protein